MTQSEIYIFCGTTATSHFPLSLTVPWTKRNPHGGLSAEEGTRLPWPACAHNSSRIWPSQPGPAPSIIVVAPAMMMMMEGGKPTRPRSSPDLRGGREGGGSRRTIGRCCGSRRREGKVIAGPLVLTRHTREVLLQWTVPLSVTNTQ